MPLRAAKPLRILGAAPWLVSRSWKSLLLQRLCGSDFPDGELFARSSVAVDVVCAQPMEEAPDAPKPKRRPQAQAPAPQSESQKP